MPVVPDAQIAQYARQGGFPDTVIPTMVAIALAESGGDTSAIGDTALETQQWGPSVGLWQIRSLNAETGKGTTRDQQANLDPSINAVHAKVIYDGSGFGAWSTYTTGIYLLYLPRGNAATSQIGKGYTVTPASTTAASLLPGGQILDFFGTLGDPNTWKRIMLIVGGFIVLIIGLYILLKAPIEKAAKAGSKIGKAAVAIGSIGAVAVPK